MHSSLRYWLWLTTRQGLGVLTARVLLDAFDSPEKIYLATPEDLERYAFPPAVLAQLADKTFKLADKILGDCQREGIEIITYQDSWYPSALRELVDPPLVLYLKGTKYQFDDFLTIALVGARECSQYGLSMGAKIALELTHAKVMVVTGMAEGIDSACVQGCLKAGGPLVSVVAGGVDMPFPRQSTQLFHDVAVAGALLSEYPPGTPHRGHHFPQRNRILSGLSHGVVVIECLQTGGTMITAEKALSQNRDLFALPGDVRTPTSRGPHLLIQQGATLVTCAKDILTCYQDLYPHLAPGGMQPTIAQQRVSDLPQEGEQGRKPPKKPSSSGEKPKTALASPPEKPKLTAEEQTSRFTDDQLKIMMALEVESLTADQLVEVTQMATKRVLSALTMLQVNGGVVEEGHRRFASQFHLDPL